MVLDGDEDAGFALLMSLPRDIVKATLAAIDLALATSTDIRELVK